MSQSRALTAISIVGAAVTDALTAQNSLVATLGGTGMVVALTGLLEARVKNATQIIEEELRRGDRNLDVSDLDGVAAIAYRYARAAQEGAARNNLRLMARVLAGQQEQKSISADDFLYYADLISGLRRNEIIYLGSLLRYNVRLEALQPQNSQELQKRYLDMQRELHASGFLTHEQSTVATSLQRTGLILSFQTGMNFTGSLGIHVGTRLLDEFERWAKLEALVREDGATEPPPDVSN
ncbi:hypothetical protein PPN31114_03497 [Pandoraea pneumonica]|uniref:Uncharacterized protein n=1 Tax=Pandoraea pneumonica TaxID=2508299 RepID=A0A5E4WXW4_9BURK|nr:hypothetical protein [Pandoraea pneumonica]VVE27905.1 hypothetical protein PPN31114_03497 [Pandoraea pneumonica]